MTRGSAPSLIRVSLVMKTHMGRKNEWSWLFFFLLFPSKWSTIHQSHVHLYLEKYICAIKDLFTRQCRRWVQSDFKTINLTNVFRTVFRLMTWTLAICEGLIFSVESIFFRCEMRKRWCGIRVLIGNHLKQMPILEWLALSGPASQDCAKPVRNNFKIWPCPLFRIPKCESWNW